MCFFVPWKNKGNVSPCELPHRSATDPLMILLTCSNWQLQIPSSWLAGKTMLLLLLLPFRSPHAQHTSVNPEKTKQQPGLKNTSEVMCFFRPLQCKYQLFSFSLLLFSVTRDALPLFSGERWGAGWDLLLNSVISSRRWDTCLRAHLPWFVSSGLRQPGHEAEALLQSRLHRLAHVQPPGHVSHHAALSAALRLPWWVSWLSPQQTSEFYIWLKEKGRRWGGNPSRLHFKVQQEWCTYAAFWRDV